MINTKIPTAYYGLAKDSHDFSQNIIERFRKLKGLNGGGHEKQVGISLDLVREFTTLRLKMGY